MISDGAHPRVACGETINDDVASIYSQSPLSEDHLIGGVSTIPFAVRWEKSNQPIQRTKLILGKLPPVVLAAKKC